MARNFTTNVPKILDRKSSSEQIFFRKLSLGAPVRVMDTKTADNVIVNKWNNTQQYWMNLSMT